MRTGSQGGCGLGHGVECDIRRLEDREIVFDRGRIYRSETCLEIVGDEKYLGMVTRLDGSADRMMSDDVGLKGDQGSFTGGYIRVSGKHLYMQSVHSECTHSAHQAGQLFKVTHYKLRHTVVGEAFTFMSWDLHRVLGILCLDLKINTEDLLETKVGIVFHELRNAGITSPRMAENPPWRYAGSDSVELSLNLVSSLINFCVTGNTTICC
jgi:hypothetical protein